MRLLLLPVSAAVDVVRHVGQYVVYHTADPRRR